MWIWEPNFKYISLTRLAECPRKDLKISCVAHAQHESSQQTAEPPPGTKRLVLHRAPLPAVPTSPPSRTSSGSYWAVLPQWHILQARASQLQRGSLAHLHRHAPAATSVSSFCIAKMPLFCLGRFEIRLTETWPFQIPTFIHLREGWAGRAAFPEGWWQRFPELPFPAYTCSLRETFESMLVKQFKLESIMLTPRQTSSSDSI